MDVMTLFFSQTSPFARKVLICVKEQNLEDKVHMELVHPLKNTDQVRAVNPLGKVPALITGTGALIIESSLICQYLDDLAIQDFGEKMSLLKGKEISDNRIRQLEALSDGIMNVAYLLVMESLRSEKQQSEFWKQRWKDAIEHTLTYIEKKEFEQLDSDENHLGKIALASALGYLDFRLDSLNWRSGVSRLPSWFGDYSTRNSYQSTIPMD